MRYQEIYVWSQESKKCPENNLSVSKQNISKSVNFTETKFKINVNYRLEVSYQDFESNQSTESTPLLEGFSGFLKSLYDCFFL